MTTKLTDLREVPNVHTKSLALQVLMIQDFGVNSSTNLKQLASFHACSKNKKNAETKILNLGNRRQICKFARKLIGTIKSLTKPNILLFKHLSLSRIAQEKYQPRSSTEHTHWHSNSILLQFKKQCLDPPLNIVSHFRISNQANFPRLRPPVQLEIADAVVKERQLVSALVLPVTRNIQLSNHRLQFFQTSLKIHRKDTPDFYYYYYG